MDKKLTLTGIGGAAVMAVIILLVQRFTDSTVDSIEEGENAAIARIVKEVIQEELKMANGKTYGEKLTEISDNQIVIKTELQTVKESLGALTED